MKILWLSHLIPYPPKGGVLQRTYYLIRELSKYHEIHLLCFNQVNLLKPFYDSIDEGVTDSKEHLSTFVSSIDVIPIPIDDIPYGAHILAVFSLLSGNPYTTNWLKSRKYHEAIKSITDKESFDLVHFDTISLIPYLKHFDSELLCLDHHNIESHMMTRRAGKEKSIPKKIYFNIEGKRLLRSEQKFCKEFDINITCSDIDTQRLEKITQPERLDIRTIPNGVDITYFTPDYDVQTNNELVFIGTMDWYPNVEAMIFFAKEVWPKLKESNPNIVMNVIGANPPDALNQMSQKDESFHTHGFVDDIKTFMNAAAVYVCPIFDGGGTKLKILDALSSGKAIVTSQIACEGIQVENNLNVLFAETADEYIDKIEYLLSNPSERIRLGKEARKLAENHYSFTSIGNNLANIFSTLKRNRT